MVYDDFYVPTTYERVKARFGTNGGKRMSNQAIKEEITIEAVGKWGVKVGERWYKTNEPLTPQSFQRGVSYSVLVKDSGKNKYICQIVGEQAAAPSGVGSGPETDKRFTSSGNWDDRDKEKQDRIIRQGVWQATVQSPALAAFAGGSYEEFVEATRKLYAEGIKVVTNG